MGARFFSFLARCAATQLQRGFNQQIVVGLGGDRDLIERDVPHLSGRCDSGLVRTGNAAWCPHQEGVHGAILDVAVVLREHIDPSTDRPNHPRHPRRTPRPEYRDRDVLDRPPVSRARPVDV